MNRNCLSLVLAALTSVAFAQSGLIQGPFVAGSGNYTTIPGGTFEVSDPLTGWFQSFMVSSVTSPTLWGDRVGLVTFPANGFYAVHKPLENSLVVGQQYVLSGFMRAEEPGGSLAIDVGNFAGQFWNQTAATAVQVDESNLTKWTFGYVIFTADNPSMTVRLVRNGPTVLNANNFFDDIAVTPVNSFVAPTPVPEPATMTALALGLLALARRRNTK